MMSFRIYGDADIFSIARTPKNQEELCFQKQVANAGYGKFVVAWNTQVVNLG